MAKLTPEEIKKYLSPPYGDEQEFIEYEECKYALKNGAFREMQLASVAVYASESLALARRENEAMRKAAIKLKISCEKIDRNFDGKRYLTEDDIQEFHERLYALAALLGKEE